MARRGARQRTAVTPEDTDPDWSATPAGSRARMLDRLRAGVGAVLLLIVALAAVRSWHDVRATIVQIAPHELVVAEVLVLGGLAASVLTWRIALSELGSTVGFRPAGKIYLLGQLGKYLPGSVWALAAQMELAAQAGVRRAHGMAASLLAIGVNLVTGVLIGLALVPGSVAAGPWTAAALVALVVVGAAALSPPVVTRVLASLLRLVRRDPLPATVTGRGVVAAAGWSLVSWVSYGLSLWVIATAAGAARGESLPLAVGGMALAMAAGFAVVVAPSGIAVREAVLVAALAPVLEPSRALAVALVTRLLFTVGDLVAAVAVVAVRIGPASGRSESRSAE